MKYAKHARRGGAGWILVAVCCSLMCDTGQLAARQGNWQFCCINLMGVSVCVCDNGKWMGWCWQDYRAALSSHETIWQQFHATLCSSVIVINIIGVFLMLIIFIIITVTWQFSSALTCCQMWQKSTQLDTARLSSAPFVSLCSSAKISQLIEYLKLPNRNFKFITPVQCSSAANHPARQSGAASQPASQ